MPDYKFIVIKNENCSIIGDCEAVTVLYDVGQALRTEQCNILTIYCIFGSSYNKGTYTGNLWKVKDRQLKSLEAIGDIPVWS